MKMKMFGMAFVLVAALGLISGCHHFGTRDYNRGYGYSSYRDGSRDDRGYDSRRDNWRDGRDDSRRRW